MSESRQLALATVLLVPSMIAAMVAISTSVNTVSSMPLLAAGMYGSVVGLVLYFVLPVGLFVLLVHATRRKGNRVGSLSFLALAAAIVAAGWWCVASWSYGERYQGYMTTVLLALLNGISALILLLGFAYATRYPSLRKNIIVHWCFVAWVFGWSIPYLGEYP